MKIFKHHLSKNDPHYKKWLTRHHKHHLHPATNRFRQKHHKNHHRHLSKHKHQHKLYQKTSLLQLSQNNP
jgi:hypothetical protein